MIDLEAKLDVTSRKPVKAGTENEPEGTSLFKIAYSMRNTDILALLMICIDKPGVLNTI